MTMRVMKRAVRRLLSGIAIATVLVGIGSSMSFAAGINLQGQALHHIDRVRFETEGSWFVIAVETQAPWAHWTLGNPARIILDLGDAQSELPNAPSLYESGLPAGPVRVFRTSQFANTAVDHRVRITLELGQIMVYEARRVGDEIQIRIEDPHPAKRARWWLTTNGLSETEPLRIAKTSSADVAAASESAVQPVAQPSAEQSKDGAGGTETAHAESSSMSGTPPSSTDKSEAPTRKPTPSNEEGKTRDQDTVQDPHDRELHRDTDDQESHDQNTHDQESHDENTHDQEFHDENTHDQKTQGTFESGAPGHEPRSGEPLADVSSPARAPARKAPRLLEALERALGPSGTQESESGQANRTPNGETGAHEPVLSESPQRHESDAQPDAESESPRPRPRRDVDPLEEAKISIETLSNNLLVDNVTESPQGEILEPGEEALEELDDWMAPEDTTEWGAEPSLEATEDVRERAASRLFAQALAAWVAGADAESRRLAERAHEFYAEYPSGRRAARLLSEMHYLEGDDALGTMLALDASEPDSATLPIPALQRLLQGHAERNRLDHVERLLESWIPIHGEGVWLEGLHLLLGLNYYRSRNSEACERHLVAITETDSLVARALAMRARLKDEAGEREAALALYSELAAMPASPYQRRGLARLADLSFQNGQIEAALSAYYLVLDTQPAEAEAAWAHYQIANCLLLGGDSAGARESYEVLVRDHASSFWAPFAEERLEMLGWRREFTRKVERLSKP